VADYVLAPRTGVVMGGSGPRHARLRLRGKVPSSLWKASISVGQEPYADSYSATEMINSGDLNGHVIAVRDSEGPSNSIEKKGLGPVQDELQVKTCVISRQLDLG